MDLKSVSALTFRVRDLAATTAFYKTLGFRAGNQDSDYYTVYLNWFSIKFIVDDKVDTVANEKTGISIDIKVDNVDTFYEGVLAAGLQPLGEPAKQPWGTREFKLLDPDGYKLTFFVKG